LRTEAVLFAAALFATPAFTQDKTAAPPEAPQRIVGTILSFDAPILTVNLGKDKAIEITLAPKAFIIANKKSALKDIKPGDFISSAALKGKDGKLKAEEVRIFPEAMRGIGEGQYPTSVPNRMLTNAAVDEIVTAARPANLKLSFHGSALNLLGVCSGHASAPGVGKCTGKTEIAVGPKVPVTLWLLGDPSWLEEGKAVSFLATADDEGKLTALGVIVEHDGEKPLL
jgi:hypothetical protein